MIKYPFFINGKDFSHLINKHGYTTDYKPVVQAYTDLNKIDHETVVRYRGCLTATTNDMSAQEAADLLQALAERPLKIRYHSFQRGRDVEEKMTFSGMPTSFLLSDGEDWVRSVPLKFTQL